MGACRAKAPYEGKGVAELEAACCAMRGRRSRHKARTVSAYWDPRPGRAVPSLIAALKKDALVRQNAALALGQIGPDARDAVPALKEALGDSEWTVRRHAAIALGHIGPDAPRRSLRSTSSAEARIRWCARPLKQRCNRFARQSAEAGRAERDFWLVAGFNCANQLSNVKTNMHGGILNWGLAKSPLIGIRSVRPGNVAVARGTSAGVCWRYEYATHVIGGSGGGCSGDR